MKALKIRITMTSPLLGTVSGNEELAKEFIIDKVINDKNLDVSEACKRAAQEEKTLPTVESELDRGTTFFHRDELDQPFIYSYMIKGYLKAACDAMIDSGEFTQEALKALKLTRYSYKSTINKMICANPRQMMLTMPAGGEMTYVERSLRAETMRGDRVCLARSEAAPEGTTTECEIKLLNPKLMDSVKYWLDLGDSFAGLGQWRSSHYGKFSWEEVK